MKKLIAVVLCVAMMLTMLCGCNKSLPLNGNLLEFETKDAMQKLRILQKRRT